MTTPRKLIALIVIGALLGLGFFLYRTFRSSAARSPYVWTYLNNPAENQEYVLKAGSRCGTAPFIFPTTGMVGYPAWEGGAITVKSLFNPSIRLGAPINLQSLYVPSANGMWNVSSLSVDLAAQMPGGPWFSDMVCYRLDGVPVP